MIDLDYYYSRKITNQKSFLWKRRLLKHGEIKKICFLFLRRMLFPALIILTAASLYYGGSFIARSPYFALHDIRFEGCKNVKPQELMSLANVRQGYNILALNLREISQKIIANPWVKDVRIERNFPHQLIIEITERVPVALASQEDLFLVDREGDLFKKVERQDNIDMPVITGLSLSEPSTQRVKEILDFLETAEHMGVFPVRTVSEVHVDGDYGITFYMLTENISIQMDLKNYSEKLALLRSLKEDLAKRKIEPQAIEIISLDEARVKIASSSKS
ncbi:MAG TPA: FtsQ-type POTRA domain-containing protein [Thermodesulfobacteriota bacterium]|nr:FtsQ-type POTRA domain-containing protein [Thermodesulfobacteriota bacterium]